VVCHDGSPLVVVMMNRGTKRDEGWGGMSSFGQAPWWGWPFRL